MDKRDEGLEAKLAEQLKGCCFGGAIYAFAECDSTMDRAHALARPADGGGSVEGTLVFAARQRKGRGRLGRTWESPEGGAYFSLILKPTRPPEEIPQLSLVAGLCVAKAIHELTGLVPSIRWPNDLLLKERKVAGILVEAKDGAVILGVGINVTTDPKLLPDTATSLSACGAVCDPYRLTATVYRRFNGWYDVWTANGFAPVREALRPWLSHVGELVRLTTDASQTEGQAMDIDETGRLLVRLDSGLVRAFDVGEVTLLR